MARFDRRGRRIGRNAWREYCVDAYRPARQAWEEQLEAACCGYRTEEEEWRQANPGPTFKGTLLGLKGSWNA